ncbi:MAG: hypothetical protein LBD23_19525 [Oscillospiraceae bacterium]|nr:hypothetical protein [Oscillospiraceae bacterium]
MNTTRKTTAEKIRSEPERKKQVENQIKRLLQQQRKEERKERDRSVKSGLGRQIDERPQPLVKLIKHRF